MVQSDDNNLALVCRNELPAANNNDDKQERNTNLQNLIAFWLLGLTNNFGYVVMLSAAVDVLKDAGGQDQGVNCTVIMDSRSRSGHLIAYCNNIGTGAILIADILPSVIVKLAAPLYFKAVPYFMKMGIVVVFGLASFPIVSTSHAVWQSLLGVVCASIASGLGALTCLSLSSFLNRNVISTWGSGTGMAGVAGSLIYAGLTSEAVGLSPRNTLISMTLIPVVQGLSYYILVKPEGFDKAHCCRSSCRKLKAESDIEMTVTEATRLIQSNDSMDHTPDENNLTFLQQMALLRPLFKYMIPLCMDEVVVYSINQGLFESIQFQNTFLTAAEQYRWFQVTYQVGIFISRSSLSLFKIKKIWTIPLLQLINLTILLLVVLFQFIPWIWLVFAIILWEGLLSGAAYVNTFYNVSKEVPDERREFAMGAASLFESIGIAIAGFVAVPAHNALCSL